MKTYADGQKVWYASRDGERLRAIIVGKGEKNGEPVFDVEIEHSENPFDRNRWGYADQITPRH